MIQFGAAECQTLHEVSFFCLFFDALHNFLRQAWVQGGSLQRAATVPTAVKMYAALQRMGGNLRGNSQYGSRLLPTGKPALEGNKQYRSQASLYQRPGAQQMGQLVGTGLGRIRRDIGCVTTTR